MSFASYIYVAFLSGMFVLHWSVPVGWRKPLLIAASYVFYCSWDYRFGALLLAVSVFSWAYGLVLGRARDPGKLLALGIVVELLPLVYFKYTNFLLEITASVARLGGSSWLHTPLAIALPLGVSFFSFQGVAYLVDVATGAKPFRSLPDFLLYKGFWPQLIAGPIVRPDEIHDQLATPRTLDYADVSVGAKRIVVGLFKKVVLADTMGRCVDGVFVLHTTPGMVDGVVAAVGFGLQIYWDFAGYSDIAIGSARLFGYRFPENFNWPYAATSPQEFWNRWHMTLSSWIRDYLFTPLSFALRSTPSLIPLALLVAMAACGLWHGAAWTFVIWGVWHGMLLVLNQTLLAPLFRVGKGEPAPLRRFVAWAVTFGAVSLGWIFFRAQTLAQAWDILTAVLTLRGGWRPMVIRENDVLLVTLFTCGLLGAQLLRARLDRMAPRLAASPRLRACGTGIGLVLCLVLTIIMDSEAQTFVYFQF